MDAATERKTYKISIPELKKIFINSKLKPPPTNAMRDFLGEMNKGVDLNEFLKPETLIPKSKLSPKPKVKVQRKVKRAKLKTFSHNIPRPNKAQGVRNSKAGVKPPPLRNPACAKAHELCKKLRSNKPSSIIRDMGCNMPVMDNETR